MPKKVAFTYASIANSKVAHLNKELVEALDAKKKKGNKYKNVKVVVDGELIDSKKEAKRMGELKLQLRAGYIIFLARQVEFTFLIDGNKICSYFADFVYAKTSSPDKLVVEDVKSEATRKLPTYSLKKKMMLSQNKIKIKEV